MVCMQKRGVRGGECSCLEKGGARNRIRDFMYRKSIIYRFQETKIRRMPLCDQFFLTNPSCCLGQIGFSFENSRTGFGKDCIFFLVFFLQISDN